MKMLARYLTEAEARLAQARLDAHGIDSRVEGAELQVLPPGYAGGAGNVLLFVDEQVVEQARDALFGEQEPEDADLARVRRRRRGLMAAVVAFIVLPPVVAALVAVIG